MLEKVTVTFNQFEKIKKFRKSYFHEKKQFRIQEH